MTKNIQSLPKYSPGQVVMSDSLDTKVSFTINSIAFTDEGWVYYAQLDATLLSVNESKITHVLNAGYWIPVEEWNPHRLYSSDKIAEDMFNEMVTQSPQEKEWLESQELGEGGRHGKKES